MTAAHRRFGLCLGVAALLLSLQWPILAVSQDLAAENPNKVKAAFLRNFAHYVTWPEKAFADARSPWRICVLGVDPFNDVLDKTLAGRTEQGRLFEIHRAETLGGLPACQIVYIAYDAPAKRRAALGELKGKPVLTVGDAPEFLREGGIIRLVAGERVQMSVNLDQARAVSLNVQTRMLEVSAEVLENGEIRKAR